MRGGCCEAAAMLTLELLMLGLLVARWLQCCWCNDPDEASGSMAAAMLRCCGAAYTGAADATADVMLPFMLPMQLLL